MSSGGVNRFVKWCDVTVTDSDTNWKFHSHYCSQEHKGNAMAEIASLHRRTSQSEWSPWKLIQHSSINAKNRQPIKETDAKNFILVLAILFYFCSIFSFLNFLSLSLFVFQQTLSFSYHLYSHPLWRTERQNVCWKLSPWQRSRMYSINIPLFFLRNFIEFYDWEIWVKEGRVKSRGPGKFFFYNDDLTLRLLS